MEGVFLTLRRFAGAASAGELLDAVEADVFALEVDHVLGVIAEDAGGLILFQNNGGAVHIDFQRIFFGDIQGAAQLNGKNDPAKLVDFAHDSSRFHVTHSLFMMTDRSQEKMPLCRRSPKQRDSTEASITYSNLLSREKQEKHEKSAKKQLHEMNWRIHILPPKLS